MINNSGKYAQWCFDGGDMKYCDLRTQREKREREELRSHKRESLSMLFSESEWQLMRMIENTKP